MFSHNGERFSMQKKKFGVTQLLSKFTQCYQNLRRELSLLAHQNMTRLAKKCCLFTLFIAGSQAARDKSIHHIQSQTSSIEGSNLTSASIPFKYLDNSTLIFTDDSQVVNFFDIGTVTEHWFEMMGSMSITNDHFMPLPIQADVNYMHKSYDSILSNLLHIVSPSDARSAVAVRNLTALSLDLVSEVLRATQSLTAQVNIFAYSNGPSENQYEPYWHLDRTPEEEAQVHGTNAAGVAVIVTLIGNPTRYVHLDDGSRKMFNAVAEDSPHSRTHMLGSAHSRCVDGSGTDLCAELDQVLLRSETLSAAPGQGSVHLVGSAHGTLHTSPPGRERLVLVITPE